MQEHVLNHKRKAFAEMLAQGGKTLTEMSEILGVSIQSLINWKKEPAVLTYAEKVKKESISFDINNIETMSAKQLSILRRKIEQVEKTLDPNKSLFSVLRRKLSEIEDVNEKRELLHEIIAIFDEFDLHPEEKFNIITVCGVLPNQDIEVYLKQCLQFKKWSEDQNITLPDSWKIIQDIFQNAGAANKIEEAKTSKQMQ